MPTMPARVRGWLEDGFRADLGDIGLEVGPPAREACAVLGARGFAGLQQVWLALDDPEAPPALPLLAHEVTHALQKRRLRERRRDGACAPFLADERAAEAEARAVARAAQLGGRRWRVVEYSDPEAFSLWGEVGHYYTVYVTMLAAGATPAQGSGIAFFAQLPDEAAELDALQTGLRWAKTTAWSLSGGAIQYFKDCVPIQHGLHALTGLPVAEEHARRLKIMSAIRPDTPDFVFDFGLACHPYGDAYAHRKDGRMYSSPLGHALDGHGPDTVNNETWKAYAEYVTTLHAIARTKFAGPERCAAGELVKRLQPIATYQHQPAQAVRIREAAEGLGSPLVSYNPFDAKARPLWQVVSAYDAHFKGRPAADTLARARRLAREWMP